MERKTVGDHPQAAVLGGILQGTACAEDDAGSVDGKVTYTFALSQDKEAKDSMIAWDKDIG